MNVPGPEDRRKHYSESRASPGQTKNLDSAAVSVDDANSAQADGRTILGLAVSNSVGLGGVRLSPLVAVQNLTGVRSAGSVSVNATGGKFFEPAPGRTLLVRMALSRDLGETP